MLGGVLISPLLLDSRVFADVNSAVNSLRLMDPSPLTVSLLMLVSVYAVAGALNLGVPDSGARYPASRLNPFALVREFRAANMILWRDRDGGLSLAVTTIFWGLGATLQFAVLRWAADVLKLPLNQAAYLQAAVAVGVVVGAIGAGRWVPLAMAKNMLVAGVVLGLLLPVIALSAELFLAIPLLVLVGAVGGLLVVPLNALLQHRGCTCLSAGRSIAVQGFNENASVLAMLGAYTALLWFDLPVVALLSGFGVAIALAMAALIWRERCRNSSEAALAAP